MDVFQQHIASLRRRFDGYYPALPVISQVNGLFQSRRTVPARQMRMNEKSGVKELPALHTERIPSAASEIGHRLISVKCCCTWGHPNLQDYLHSSQHGCKARRDPNPTCYT